MKTSRNVLVIAAHPDDEVLGCGATIARLTAEGHQVRVVIAATGLTSRSGKPAKEQNHEISQLKETCRKANRVLGVSDIEFLDFPDNRMDSIDLLEVVKKIEIVSAEFRPSWIFTHHSSDLNIDHRLLNHAVMTAFRPMPGRSVERIHFFEVPSATGWLPTGSASDAFVPQSYCDVSAHLDKKLEALRIYSGEMRPFPHARSEECIRALATYRGASVGVNAAEAFVLARDIF